MKNAIKALVLLLTINTGIMAQKGFTLEKEIVINVSEDQLWDMIGPGFIDVYKWSSNVDHAEGKGQSEFEGAVCNERFCDVNVTGFSKISEELTIYDASKKTLAYAVKDGMPGFVTKAVNQWTVVRVDDSHAKLVMKAEFGSKGLMGSMMNGMMKKKMGTNLETVLNDAKIYAETGQVSQAKQDRMNQLQKKAAA